MSPLWQPLHPPPDPRTVSGLSADAERVMKAIIAQHQTQSRSYYCQPARQSLNNNRHDSSCDRMKRTPTCINSQEMLTIHTPQRKTTQQFAYIYNRQTETPLSTQELRIVQTPQVRQVHQYISSSQVTSTSSVTEVEERGSSDTHTPTHEENYSRPAEKWSVSSDHCGMSDLNGKDLFGSNETRQDVNTSDQYENCANPSVKVRNINPPDQKSCLKERTENSRKSITNDHHTFNSTDMVGTNWKHNYRFSQSHTYKPGEFLVNRVKHADVDKPCCSESESLAELLVSQLGNPDMDVPTSGAERSDSPPLDLSQSSMDIYQQQCQFKDFTICAEEDSNKTTDVEGISLLLDQEQAETKSEICSSKDHQKMKVTDNTHPCASKIPSAVAPENKLDWKRSKTVVQERFDRNTTVVSKQGTELMSRKDMDKNWNSGKLKQGILCFQPRGKLSITAVKSVADKELSKIESLLSGTNKVTDPKKRKNKSSFTVPAKRKDRKDETKDNTLHEEHVTNNGLSMSCQLRDVSMMSSDEKKVLEVKLENVSEVAITLVYSDGSSQLRGSEVTSGKRKQSAAENEKVFGIALTWLSVSSDLQLQKYADSSKSEHTMVLFPLEGQNSELQKWQGDTLCRLLRSSVKKVCYEAQNMIGVFLNHFSADFSQVIKNFVIYDPKVAAWLLDPDHTPASFSQTLNWHTTLNQSESQSNLSEHLDSDLILLLFCMQQLENRLVECELLELYLNVELPLCPLLAVMETRAMKVDTKTHQHFSDILKMKLDKLEAEACKTVGFQFSLNSHVQLRQVLFEKLQLDLKLPKGSKGIDRTSVSREKSTSEAVLSRLQGTHPLPDIILQHRQLQKLKSTYIDGITAYITDGQLRTHWDQTSAATGRLTSTNPNVQSMPKQPTIISGFKDSFIVGKENDDREDIFARDVFISKEGFSFLAADFQQIELRLLAHLSGDARLIQLFSSQDSADVFTKLTAQWLNKPLYKVKSVDREQTKRIVYSVMYGVGKEKLADYLKTSSEAAAAVMNSFLVSFPVINLFTKKCVEECQQKAYLTTIFKRRRLFPNIKHSSAQLRAQAIRQAVNFRVQGSAADLCKAAMIQVERKLVEQSHINASLLLQIHDELLLEVKDSQIPEVADLLKAVMEDADTLCGGMAKLKVPIQVSLSIGKTWGHLQPYPVKYDDET